MLAQWWVWLSAGVVLAIIEVFAPGFFFLGFAVGAAVTGLILLAGGPLATWLAGSVAYLFVFFAIVSLLSWLALRRVVGVRKGQIKLWTRDINED
jgi:inner membrane protein